MGWGSGRKLLPVKEHWFCNDRLCKKKNHGQGFEKLTRSCELPLYDSFTYGCV